MNTSTIEPKITVNVENKVTENFSKDLPNEKKPDDLPINKEQKKNKKNILKKINLDNVLAFAETYTDVLKGKTSVEEGCQTLSEKIGKDSKTAKDTETEKEAENSKDTETEKEAETAKDTENAKDTEQVKRRSAAILRTVATMSKTHRVIVGALLASQEAGLAPDEISEILSLISLESK